MEEQVAKKPHTGVWLWILGTLAALVILAAAGWYMLFYWNVFTLSVQLDGETELLLEYGDAYEEPGFSVDFRGTHFLTNGMIPEDVSVQVHSDLVEDVLGKYTITYTAQFHGWEASAQRSIRVADTQAPEIVLIDESDETILPGVKYEEEGYIATDNYDGDITDRVKRVENMGMISYTVMDSSGNPAYVEREIPYFDPLPPEIILTEGEHIVLPLGTVYEEPGLFAYDNADGDVTEFVSIEGEVIWYQPGSYPITYSVTDTYGNESTVTRTVEVQAQPRPDVVYPKGKVIYLTFDDGPGPYTNYLLNLLDHYGVKATFFVTDSGYDNVMKKIVDRGHSIGIHTVTHDYNTIYSSPEAYFEDLYRMQDVIYNNTGVKTTLLRFPGGGSNLVSKFNPGIMTLLTEAVQDAGFQYFDWNVDSNDAGGALRRKTVAANVIGGVSERRVSVVLQHDIHDFSVEAVEDIIEWGLDNGYKFLPLTPNSPNAHHEVNN